MDTKPVKTTRSFQANKNNLHDMLSMVRMAAQDAGLEEKQIKGLELATEEAIVNIIYHAYEKRKGLVHIEVQYEKGKEIVVYLFDRGDQFDPHIYHLHNKPKKEIEKEGGLGIMLMHNYVDEIEYRRSDPFNCLVLRKAIDSSL